MKRGDTAILPPDGVCEYCGTDEPGGTHAFQRWSRVQLRVTNECNIMRSFILCRKCYVATLPSQQGTVEMGIDGQLIILTKKGNPVSRKPGRAKKLCIVHENKKVRFTPDNRNAVMSLYWESRKERKVAERKVAEILPPNDAISLVS